MTTQTTNAKKIATSYQKGIKSSIPQGVAPLPSITQKQPGLSPNMGTMAQEAAKDANKKQKNFLMTPYIILDNDMHETSIVGFLRLMRKFGKSGLFVGSYRKLCKALNMARNTVMRMVADWVKAGWVSKVARDSQEESSGDVMCLMLLTEDIWQANTALYGNESPEQGVSQIGTACPNLGQDGSNLGQAVPELTHTDPNWVQAVPDASTKPTPILGKDIDSYIIPDMREGYGAEQQPQTPEPPVLPSSMKDEKFFIEDITHDTPLCWEAFHAIGAHYLGAAKVTRQDAEVLVAKYQTVAGLITPLEVYRQFVTSLTFMCFSDHPSNWFRGDKRRSLTLRSVATYSADYQRKAQDADWHVPPDKAPSWFFAPEPEPESPVTQAGDSGGMERHEAEALMTVILAQCPGAKTSYGDLGGNRFTVGLWDEGGWIDFYGHDDWREWAARFLAEPEPERETAGVA